MACLPQTPPLRIASCAEAGHSPLPNPPCMKDAPKWHPGNLQNETKPTEMGIHGIEDCHEWMAESEFSNFKNVAIMSKWLQFLVTTFSIDVPVNMSEEC